MLNWSAAWMLFWTVISRVTKAIRIRSLNAYYTCFWFAAFTVRSKSIYSWLIVISSILYHFAFKNSLLSLLTVVFIVQFAALYYSFRYLSILCQNSGRCCIHFVFLRHSAAHVGHAEATSRLRLFQNVHNDLSGRAVLQSFNQVRLSRNRCDWELPN